MKSRRSTRNGILLIVVLALLAALGGCRVPDVAPAPAGGWLGNDMQALRDSAWFQQHGYVDCPKDADDFWPESRLDCVMHFFPEVTVESDLAESGEITIKHFTPTDFLELFPESGAPIRRMANLTRDILNGELRERVLDDAERYSSVSVNSLLVGLEGRTVRSISLMVHPLLERVIVERIGVEKRAELLFQPYLEGALGREFSAQEVADVNDLYLSALDRCGANAIDGDQSGLGANKSFGNFVAEIQLLRGDGSGDCHIHIESN